MWCSRAGGGGRADMFLNVQKYVINTDHIAYIELKEHEIVVYLTNGVSVVIDRSWLSKGAVDELGLAG